ncbi:unnamed protein product [Adineta ricciae]|uniref:Uncharacterized protein n=1 Tax=Adineta ricciae TaxID=249248 RepID=A0A814IS93_ADIRI|nr:unnamed protein product [Adineta ricciae]
MDDDQIQQPPSSSVPLLDDVEPTEETPLNGDQLNEGEEDFLPCVAPEIYDWNTSLISQICREGDLHRLRLFIDYSRQMTFLAEHASQIADRIDIDTGLSPLHHAARYQQLHVCVILLSNLHFKFGVNIKDANGRTPIHSAFHLSHSTSDLENQIDMEIDFGDQLQDKQSWQDDYTTNILASDHPLIYLFAKANGDINARDKYLLTPLHYAVAQNKLSGVKQLLTLGADIEAEDRQGIRPFHLACKEGYIAILEYLIEHEVEIDATDVDHWTSLHYACSKGHFDVVKLIHSKAKSNFQDLLKMTTNTNTTCLHLAVQNGNIQLVEFILKEYTNDDLKLFINEQTEPLGTALHIAAKLCDPEMIDLLFNYGAEPILLNSKLQSSLHIASVANRLEIIQELYKLTGVLLLEIKDRRGQTALSVTTSASVVDQLIFFGADITSLDNNNMNAIMIAVSAGQLTIVNRLLSVLNDQLYPILDQVEKRNDYSIFLIAVQTGSVEMCSLLLTHSYIRWNTVDKQRRNAFHIAARNDHYDVIEFLCDYIQKSDRFMTMKSRSYSTATTIDSDSVNIIASSPILRSYLDAQDEDGKTPLHLAAEQGHISSIEVLLRYHADVLLANYLGQLPLHVAIQNGHSQCVELLIRTSVKDMNEFRSVLSRRQSPLISACQNGFVDIAQLLLCQNLGVDFDPEKEETPLEIAIRYRQNDIIHVLLQHPQTESWLMSKLNSRQTPLREMIRYMPDCAYHTFDRLILKTTEMDLFGKIFERTIYKYKHLDDYFLDNDKLYTSSSRQLYRNHPLIIALDSEHHSLLDHPLCVRLMERKWKLYRSLFYFPRILAFLLLSILTVYALIIPAPLKTTSTSSTLSSWLSSIMLSSTVRWIIIVLSLINLLKIFSEIILYRGFRVPFAQLFGIVSFASSILAFIPHRDASEQMKHLQWQLVSFAILFQWFNTAVILRSVPFFGHFLIMLESVLTKFTLLVLAMFPLLIAFTISFKMIFFNHSAFVTLAQTMHKSSSMIVGEFDYETLFFSKAAFTAASFIFIPFVVIMTIVFLNLLLGITVGDIQDSVENARAKANAYWIRELIYIETTLPSTAWLKSNVVEDETVSKSLMNDFVPKQTESEEEEDDDDDESVINHPYAVELRKLLDILQTLCVQAKQVLEQEIDLEKTLKQLLKRQRSRDSSRSDIDKFLRVKLD